MSARRSAFVRSDRARIGEGYSPVFLSYCERAYIKFFTLETLRYSRDTHTLSLKVCEFESISVFPSLAFTVCINFRSQMYEYIRKFSLIGKKHCSNQYRCHTLTILLHFSIYSRFSFCRARALRFSFRYVAIS